MSRYVILCGGRDHPPFTRSEVLWLERLYATNPFAELIVGSHQGADLFGHEWAQSRGITTMTFWANWQRDGRAAGPVRNTRMLLHIMGESFRVSHNVLTLALVVAFPGGKGTADMCHQASFAGVEVLAWPPP